MANASRREIGKAERRRRILEAAAALVREVGFNRVSMVDIAARAQVSPATLYNLFQTKSAIFQQVADLDLEVYEQIVARTPAKDALDRIFVGVSVAVGLYRREPHFYRAMTRAGGPANPLSAAINEPRVAYLRERVREAVTEGCLRAEAKPEVLGIALAQLMRGAIIDWAIYGVSPDRMEIEAHYGFALILLAYVADDHAEALKKRIGKLERQLAAERR